MATYYNNIGELGGGGTDPFQWEFSWGGKKSKPVLSAKDLNPTISNFWRYITLKVYQFRLFMQRNSPLRYGTIPS